MAQTSRVAVQFAITCSAEKFYRGFRKNMDLLVQMIPEDIKGCKIVQGNEFCNVAVIIWNYDFEMLRDPMTVKIRQDTEDAAETITYTMLEGDVLETFKSFVVKLKVEQGAAKWSIEFEKIYPNTPNLNGYLELYKKNTREFEAYLG